MPDTDPEPRASKLQMFCVRLPAEILAEMRKLAQENRRTVAAQVLIIIEAGLKALRRRKS